MCRACWPAAEAAIKKLPQVQGQEQVQGGPELGKLLQATEKEAIKRNDQFIASELFLLAVADHKGELGNLARANGLTARAWRRPSRPCAVARTSTVPTPRASVKRSRNTALT
jgi:ATP-dependent Clp protease ATP-binding subunit ClpA